jgi:hypothetical protein
MSEPDYSPTIKIILISSSGELAEQSNFHSPKPALSPHPALDADREFQIVTNFGPTFS